MNVRSSVQLLIDIRRRLDKIGKLTRTGEVTSMAVAEGTSLLNEVRELHLALGEEFDARMKERQR